MKRKTIFFCLPFLLLFLSLGCTTATKPVKILMAGDSTMADKPLFKQFNDSLTGESKEEIFLERGWGQLLPELITSKGTVVNFARNGRSTRTFVEEGLWDELIDTIIQNDIVIVQFGHNDGVITKKSYTNPAQFRLNFVGFVSEVKSKGGLPILCTPVARRKFNNNGDLESTHGDYPDIIRNVATQENVPLIDMEILTSKWLQEAGIENSKQFFHKLPPGVSKLYPKGLDDNTHFNELGARKVAQIFVEEAKRQKIKQISHLFK